jgi:hypothetical protein
MRSRFVPDGVMSVHIEPTQLQIAHAFYVRTYGQPDRPIEEAIDSDYYTLAEELALAHAGIAMRRTVRRRTREEQTR